MNAPARPIALRVNPRGIPQALQDLEQWVLWRYELRGGNYTKVPRSRYGAAKSNDPTTWDNFRSVYAAYERGGYDGVGICLAPGDSLVGIDLDKCLDSSIEEMSPQRHSATDQICEWFDHTYQEVSPSGKGLRMFCYGQARRTGKGGDGNWIEVYDHTSPRYLTITGHAYNGQPIRVAHEALDWLHDQYMKKPEPTTIRRAPTPTPVTQDIQQLLNRARSATNGSNFIDLYDRGIIGGDHSSADLRLCNMLAFWCGGDPNMMDRAFRSSALMRDKWDSPRGDSTYGAATIDKALAYCSQTYDPGYNSGRTQHQDQSQDPTPNHQAEPEPEDPTILETGAHDEGNARALHIMYGSKFCHVEAYGWLYYNGTHWERAGAEAHLDRAIVAMLKERRRQAAEPYNERVYKAAKPSATNVRGCKFLFKSMVTRQVEEFDNYPDQLNVLNGVVNLKTGDLIPHNPDLRFTNLINIRYNPGADQAEWLDFLKGIVAHESVVPYLQESIGYSLTGHTSEEVLWYIYGPTRSGKGTFTEIIMQLLGRPLCSEVDFATFTRNRENDASNFDLAPLKPARLIFASESSRHQRLNTAKVKALTGGNDVYCCYKNKDHFNYRPLYKIWLTSNHPVNADTDDDAVWGRLRVLQFPHSRLGTEDKGLKARLKQPENLEGVLAWAVTGAQEWYRRKGSGLETPEIVTELTQAVREDQDTVQQWIDETISVTGDPDNYLINSELYESYQEWCQDNGVTPKKQKGLTQSLNAKGIEGPKVGKVSSKTKRLWRGVAFQ